MSKIRDTFGLSVLLLCLMFVTSGCQRLMAAIEEEVEQYVAGDNPDTGKTAGSARRDPRDSPACTDGRCKRHPQLRSTQPRTTRGGNLVDVVGTGFLRYEANGAPSITLGRNRSSCTNLQVISDNLIRCLTPPGTLAEAVTLRLQVFIEPGISAEVILANAYSYYSPVELDRIQPNRLPSQSGQRLFCYRRWFRHRNPSQDCWSKCSAGDASR